MVPSAPEAVLPPCPAPMLLDWPGVPAGRASWVTAARRPTPLEDVSPGELDRARPAPAPPAASRALSLLGSPFLLRCASPRLAGVAGLAFASGRGRADLLVEVLPA